MRTKALYAAAALCPAVLLLLAVSCTQEHFILLRNLNRTVIVSPEQVLKEAGLKLKDRGTNLAAVDQTVSNTNAVKNVWKPRAFDLSKIISVPADEDFSVNLGTPSGTIVLKSVQGGLVYMRDRSRTDMGLYLFHSGEKDGKITFQLYDEGGALLTNYYYYVKTDNNKVRRTDLVRQDNAASSRQSVSSGVFSSASSSQAPTNTGELTGQTDTNSAKGVFRMIASTIEGMAPVDALRELGKLYDSPDLGAADRQEVLYKMLDIMLAERMYGQAEKNVQFITDSSVKQLYSARLSRAKKRDREAVQSYLQALAQGGADLKKKAILELEDYLLQIGAVEKSLIDRLSVETAALKQDRGFYGASLLGIARIYQYLPDVYASKELLEQVLNGDFSEALKKKARAVYDQLEKEFLNYR